MVLLGGGRVNVSDDETNEAYDVDESEVGESDDEACRLDISEGEFNDLDSSIWDARDVEAGICDASDVEASICDASDVEASICDASDVEASICGASDVEAGIWIPTPGDPYTRLRNRWRVPSVGRIVSRASVLAGRLHKRRSYQRVTYGIAQGVEGILRCPKPLRYRRRFVDSVVEDNRSEALGGQARAEGMEESVTGDREGGTKQLLRQYGGGGGQRIPMSVNDGKEHSGQNTVDRRQDTVDWLLRDSGNTVIDRVEEATGRSRQLGSVKRKRITSPDDERVRLQGELTLQGANSGVVVLKVLSEDRVSQVTGAVQWALVSCSIVGQLVCSCLRGGCWWLLLMFHAGYADEWPRRWLLLWRGHRPCMCGSKGDVLSTFSPSVHDVMGWMTSWAVRTPSLDGGYTLARGCGRKRVYGIGCCISRCSSC
ncbi:hypothetical protein C0Q70_03719 [Pomacea canaliculata]|uniref:Uncharacterized protein n=1 Tax=Pomacea canaliculata TaxID=400727 RepID=A0A2T7PTI0_POMCA|nr:hypothetical protein C0Q70_03719 [Pomacea canaliculata]